MTLATISSSTIRLTQSLIADSNTKEETKAHSQANKDQVEVKTGLNQIRAEEESLQLTISSTKPCLRFSRVKTEKSNHLSGTGGQFTHQ